MTQGCPLSLGFRFLVAERKETNKTSKFDEFMFPAFRKRERGPGGGGGGGGGRGFHFELSHFFNAQVFSNCIDTGYFVCAKPDTVLYIVHFGINEQ